MAPSAMGVPVLQPLAVTVIDMCSANLAGATAESQRGQDQR